MTRTVTSAGGFRLVLPGTWSSIPLGDAERTRSEVQRLVRERVGRADRLARARREASDALVALAADAGAISAHTLLLALELLPGVPFAASITGRDLAWSVLPAGDMLSERGDANTKTENAELLAMAYPGHELRELRAGVVARVAERGVLRAGEQSITTAVVEYRVPHPTGSRVLLLRCTAPEFGSLELTEQLFDAMVDSLTWLDEGAS